MRCILSFGRFLQLFCLPLPQRDAGEEISLTSTPANPAARVLHRHRHSPVVEAYDLANAGVSKCAEVAKVLAAMNRGQQRSQASVRRIRVWLVGRE